VKTADREVVDDSGDVDVRVDSRQPLGHTPNPPTDIIFFIEFICGDILCQCI
jgi:hypothetical protein